MNSIFNPPSYFAALGKLAIVSLIILLSNLVAISPVHAEVTQMSASVDRNTVLLDESFQLSVIANGTAERDAIDFSALANDFRVSTPSFSQSTQIVNGSMSRTVTWTVNLYPRQIGTFTIPSFTIDGQASREFTLRVLPVNTASSDQPREFYVTATIDNDVTYLQQQISYRVKIHLSRDIQRGQLSLPELEGALIEQIGEDEDYQEIIDGVRYRIIERTYALIPQASGSFTITGPIFEADVSTNSRRSFANFGRTAKIARRAPDLLITVRPIPDTYNHTWLPSELVEITEQWQGNTEPFVVGEPVTRTITLTALGLTEEQLPSIDLPYHPSFKVYPEQANLATVERNNKLIAQGVFNSAIIPEQAGDFILPEARIPWFNVNTQETEFAILPARTVSVIDKVANLNPLSQTPAAPVSPNLTDTELSTESSDSPLQVAGFDWLHYVLISTNIFALIALYVVWLTRKKLRKNKVKISKPAAIMSEEEAFKRVKSLLEQNKVNGLSASLEEWLTQLLGAQHYSISASLASFPQTHALEQYNLILGNAFSNKQGSIDFAQFIKSLDEVRVQSQASKNQDPLRILYPS